MDNAYNSVENYEAGNKRRYELLLAVNGGSYAIWKWLSSDSSGSIAGLLGSAHLGLAMIFFTFVMCMDIFAFGKPFPCFSRAARLVVFLTGWVLMAVWWVVGVQQLIPARLLDALPKSFQPVPAILFLGLIVYAAILFANLSQGAGTKPDDQTFTDYEAGKKRRYELLFALNGGVFLIATLRYAVAVKASEPANGVVLIDLPVLSIVMLLLTMVICLDIYSFGLTYEDRGLFGPIGRWVILLLSGMLMAAWILVSDLYWLNCVAEPTRTIIAVFLAVVLALIVRCFAERLGKPIPPIDWLFGSPPDK